MDLQLFKMVPLMVIFRYLAVLAALALSASDTLEGHASPELGWLKPTAGQVNSVVELEIHGSALVGTHAVWLGGEGCTYAPLQPDLIQPTTSDERTTITTTLYHLSTNPDGLEATIRDVLVSDKPNIQDRAIVRMTIKPDTRVGLHELRLVSPGGLSNRLSFAVVPEMVIDKHDITHNTPGTAHPISIPAAISGRFSGPHRLHYYSFDVAAGQTIGFKVPVLQGADRLDGQLMLYETTGSWLDPGQSRRLVFNEEKAYGIHPTNHSLTHHFTRTGRYIVEIGSIFGQAGMGYSYLLRVNPVKPVNDERNDVDWARDRLHAVISRSSQEPPDEARERSKNPDTMDPGSGFNLVTSNEPDGENIRDGLFSLPAILTGSIEEPGDIDWFRFNNEPTTDGLTLTFEVDTPRITGPFFHPCLEVLDPDGKSILTNVETEETRIKGIGTGMSGTFKRKGEYRLRIWGISSIHGDPGQVYRILVRPEVPHVTHVLVREDRINLARGKSASLHIDTQTMEGFEGELAISPQDLPEGIHARFSTTEATIVLVADNNAPMFPIPRVLHLTGQIMDSSGRPGRTFPIGKLPIMVTN